MFDRKSALNGLSAWASLIEIILEQSDFSRIIGINVINKLITSPKKLDYEIWKRECNYGCIIFWHVDFDLFVPDQVKGLFGQK